MTEQQNDPSTILVTGGTGKIGRRVASRLAAAGVPTRIGSRTATPPFDWEQPSTWSAALAGSRAAFVNFAPDISIPGAPEIVRDFADSAVRNGVQRLVVLIGRGGRGGPETETYLRDADIELTVLRCAWFAQNFSEGEWSAEVNAGAIALPGDVAVEPFIDADDIADVAVAALTDDAHIGETYELTGPRLLTFAQVVSTISDALGRPVRLQSVSLPDYLSTMRSYGVPESVVAIMDHLFRETLDGRNSRLGDGVERALGRRPRDIAEFARTAAAAGAWQS